MSKDIPKRKVGRPPKTDATNTDVIVAKIEQELKNFGAECADRLPRYFKVISGTALADEKKVGVKDRVGAAKFCIEFAADFLEQEQEEKSKSKQPKTPPKEEPETKKRLISLVD